MEDVWTNYTLHQIDHIPDRSAQLAAVLIDLVLEIDMLKKQNSQLRSDMRELAFRCGVIPVEP